MIRRFLKKASCLLFPPICEICDTPIEEQSLGVCEVCFAQIQRIEAPFCLRCGRGPRPQFTACPNCADESFYFDRAYAYAWYNGRIKELIHAYKFKGQKYLANFFSTQLFDFFNRHLKADSWDGVLSVPLPSNRLRERGFNQSKLLSDRLSRQLSLPELSGLWTRVKNAGVQSHLSKKERAKNLEDRFLTKPGVRLSGERLLLVDDILTTGQTASQCAKVLKNAGASSVTLLALARGL